MSKIITASKLNRLWKNGVLAIKSTLEGSINTEKTERQTEIATERARIDNLEETSGTVENKLSTYNDIMANTVEGYLPDALGVKEGFNQVNDSLNTVVSLGYKTESGTLDFSSSGHKISDFKFVMAQVYNGSSNTWMDVKIIPAKNFLTDSSHSYNVHFYVGGTVFSIMFKAINETSINVEFAAQNGSFYFSGVK